MKVKQECQGCKHWDFAFEVENEDIGHGLTKINANWGYCMLDQYYLKVPVWMREVVRAMETPLVSHSDGEDCPCWEECDPDEPRNWRYGD